MNNSARLDRLSALLQGLAPRVEVIQPRIVVSPIAFDASSRQFLYLHLIPQGQVRLRVPQGDCRTITGPAIVVCRADTTHSLAAVSDEAFETLMSAKAFLDGPAASLLLSEFTHPRVVLVNEADSSLQYVIHLISSELMEPRCGQPALLDRAGDILFIGLLRHLIAHPLTPNGLFNGLADQRIARALVAMHTKPQWAWTLEKLAEEAGMSRTSFATRFREIMNHPPGKYLGKLRLSIAHRAVLSGLGLKRAAKDSGYESTSALSRALSRANLPGGF